MEVGAVKQAFNNEVIHLKKKLNQAKIQTIHKLTRKAKTLNGKKTPDHLKEKVKRKAQSAITEVLTIKKIKPKEIAKFIITHKGNLTEYLNRPTGDNEKACARLLFHKSLQDKYEFIRNRFGNIPIKDLFMSRQERLKLKAEAKEQQKNKKKAKRGEVTNSVGDWDVVDVEMSNKAVIDKGHTNDHMLGHESDNKSSNDNTIAQENYSGSGKENSDHEMLQDNVSDENIDNSDENSRNVKYKEAGKLIKLKHKSVKKLEQKTSSKVEEENCDDESINNDDADDVDDDNNSKHENVGKLIKITPKSKDKPVVESKNIISKIESINTIISQIQQKPQQEVKETVKKIKENKKKNLKEKLQNRKFKKDEDDNHIEGSKVVDPFFITASGENYLSLAEPRLPDEIKEVHKQGNRQERRAAKFGREFIPKNEFGQNNFRPRKYDNNKSNSRDYRNNSFKVSSGSEYNDRSGKYSDRNGKFNDKNNKFNNDREIVKKDEKLHPSWEAKRKLKSISLLPSQGKKIVFDDN